MVSLILEVVKADKLKMLSKGFIFVFEFRIHRTIKRDANLVQRPAHEELEAASHHTEPGEKNADEP